ncbi:MAG: PCRF domain-containing protein, partial [Acutalibacteraceae bacterium]|nr:PCRF domain-containing protein [Acutalibacteraceae bacterium]
MLQFEELRLELLECRKPLDELAEALGLEEMRKEIAALEEKAAAPDFWDDMKNSQKILQKTATLKNKVAAYEKLNTDYEDALIMIELSNEEEDESMFPDCRESVDAVKKELDKQTLSTLLSGEYDSKNAILTFHAGAGGTEAQDWASMLVRMYTQWGTKNGYKVTMPDFLDGDEAGYKSAVLH